jgi:hypothetical protein
MTQTLGTAASRVLDKAQNPHALRLGGKEFQVYSVTFYLPMPGPRGLGLTSRLWLGQYSRAWLCRGGGGLLKEEDREMNIYLAGFQKNVCSPFSSVIWEWQMSLV